MKQRSNETQPRFSETRDHRSKPCSARNQRRGSFQTTCEVVSQLPIDSEMKPCDADVILGRGRAHKAHPGNRYMHDLVIAQVPDYSRANREGKTNITWNIVKQIRATGGKFLQKHTNGSWFEIAEKEARLKVSHAMRDCRSKTVVANVWNRKNKVISKTAASPQRSSPVARREQQGEALPSRQEAAQPEARTAFRLEHAADLQTAAILNQLGTPQTYHPFFPNRNEGERRLRGMVYSLQPSLVREHGNVATSNAPFDLSANPAQNDGSRAF